MNVRIELVVDGIVHYDKIHDSKFADKVVESLKKYIQSKQYYLCNFELSKYVMSNFERIGVDKLCERDKRRAIQLMEIYTAKVVAKRYNINYQTLYRYKRQMQAL